MSTDPPLRILLSHAAIVAHGHAIAALLDDRPHRLVDPGDIANGDDADIAFVSRDVTGLSTKHEILPATQAFYDALLAAPSLRWVQAHSAGADRAIYVTLRDRGVQVTTASGANAEVVAQTALAGLLALSRRFPQMMAAQQARKWAPLSLGELPRDLAGQRATLVGWGPIARHLARCLDVLGLRIAVARSSAEPAAPGVPTVAFESLQSLLPTTDWLVLACPLSPRTRGLVDAAALAGLPPHAHLVNIARGELVDEAALIAALRSGHLAGAFLDVFHHEPLPADSPLWAMPNVIATPHSAGFSDGNAARVAQVFLDNLRRWIAREPLMNPA